MQIADEQIKEKVVLHPSDNYHINIHDGTGITFSNITCKELIKELSTSSIYKCKINNKEYVSKVIYKNPNMDFNNVLKSYQNYQTLMSKDGIVDVYDFRISDCGEKFEVLMEDLRDRKSVV